jgi:hypothetical protein
VRSHQRTAAPSIATDTALGHQVGDPRAVFANASGDATLDRQRLVE